MRRCSLTKVRSITGVLSVNIEVERAQLCNEALFIDKGKEYNWCIELEYCGMWMNAPSFVMRHCSLTKVRSITGVLLGVLWMNAPSFVMRQCLSTKVSCCIEMEYQG